MSKYELPGDSSLAATALPSDSLQSWANQNLYSKDSLPTRVTKTTGGVNSERVYSSQEVQNILGHFAIDSRPDAATVARTEELVKAAGLIASSSSDASIVALANRLSKDPVLTQMVTDASGSITKGAIDSIRLADSGALALQEKSKHPVTRVLTEKQREDLQFVAGHSNALGQAGLAAGAVAGASGENLAAIVAAKTGISAAQLVKTAAAEIRAKSASEQAQEKTQVRNTDQAPIDADHFAAVAKRVVAKLDTGHTGGVTKEQLAKALQDPSFKGQDAQALVALYQNFDQLHNLSGHEGYFGTKSITAADLDKYQKIELDRAVLRQETGDMKDWAHHNLTRFTQHGSDRLTKDDIDRALKDNNLSTWDRSMLQTVKKHYDQMGNWYRAGLGVKDFDDFDDKSWKDDTAKLVGGVFSSCYSVANDAQKKGTVYDLYAGKDPLKAIRPEGVRQGAIGDCYYEAVVASIARTNPALIRDSIKDNHNGTYTVTFPGDKGEPITVKAPTEAELGLYNRGSSNGVWASVLEKAYGQYCENHSLFGSNTPQEGADGGGRPEPVIKLFTGKESDTYNVDPSHQAEMAKHLQDAFSSHPPRLVVSGIDRDSLWNTITFRASDKTADQFYRNHEYTITNFIPDGHGGGKVVIRNPWGLTDGTPDGTIEIPLDEFMKNFSDVSIQK